MINLIKNSRLVITDSGGLQKKLISLINSALLQEIKLNGQN